MFALPSIPGWDASHPAVSHFPIALLVIAPVLLLAGLLSPGRRQGLLAFAFALTVAGTLGVYVSAATGDAARDVASKAPPIASAIAEHEDLGSLVRAVFSVLAVLLAALLHGPRLLRRPLAPATSTALAWVLFVVFVCALLPLYNAAHSGAILVHRLGVHAKL
ncbi:MAG: hypothetical protein IPL90_05020 [Holophagales bacterium]|nr:hypothetical protein [Holophagales bacterium]